MNNKSVFCVAVFFVLFSTSVFAEEYRCKTSDKELAPQLAQIIKNFAKKGDKTPQKMVVQSRAWFETDSADGYSRNVVYEAYLRPKPGFYRVVPGLGLGVELDSYSVLYTCLELIHPAEKSQIKIIFMQGSGMDGTWGGAIRPSARISARNLRISPAGEITSLLGDIPFLGIFSDLFDTVVVTPAMDLLGMITGFFAATGVERITIRPNTLELDYGLDLILAGRGRLATQSIELDSSWMLESADWTREKSQ